MAIISKVETEVEIKSPADKFFHRISKERHHTPDASSDNIHAIEVHEGDFQTHGESIKTWSYTIDGEKESIKEKFEIDEEKKTVAMVAVEGHVLERYKTYRAELTVVPKAEDGLAVVKVTVEVEKHNVADPDPVKERDFLATVIKDVDEHLLATLT